MMGSNLLQMMLAAALAMVLLAVVMLPGMRRKERIDARIRAVAGGVVLRSGSAPQVQASSNGHIGHRVLRAIGQVIVSSGLLSGKSIEDLEQTMSATGAKTSTTLPLFVGAKVALLIGAPVAVWVLMTVTGYEMHPKILPIMGGAVVGMLLPDYLVRKSRKKYLTQLENGLPDALDLLIICSEAGLALEAGFDRVAAEFGDSNVPTASELRTTASEMKILSDRRRALVNMGLRTKLEVMGRLGGTLAQTIQYGTPISQALRVLAAEMRQTTLTRFEEKAAKLPVMLTIPMILFILPCVFLVVGGPAVVGVMETIMHK